MALTLPWLVAAVVSALGGMVWTPTAPLVDRVVSRVVNDAAATLAGRRGVRLTRPLVVRLVDKDEMAAAAGSAVAAAEGPGADREPRQALLAHLGLAPAPATSAPPPLSLAEVTGLYDMAHDRLLLANWADLASGRFTVARDIAQALLDRRFDLGRWLVAPTAGPARRLTFDAALARAALAYGDATTQALEHLDPEGTLPSSRALAQMSETIRDQLLAKAARSREPQSPFATQRRFFLELDGLQFVAGIRARSPWAAVDEVWRRPPRSTEQIFHPHKYERAETPDDLSARLPEQPQASWRIVHRDTLGEWGVRLFLSQGGNDYRAARAAAGWGGDSALLVRAAPADARPNGEPAASHPATFAAWITTWDDDTEADDFAAEAAAVLAQLAHVSLVDARPASGRLRMVDSAGRLFALDHRRATVGLLVDAPTDAEGLLATLMAAAAPSPATSSARRPDRSPAQARPRPR